MTHEEQQDIRAQIRAMHGASAESLTPWPHTPTPWRIGQSSELDEAGELVEQLALYSAQDGVKTVKVETWLGAARAESDANAAFIVQAVNERAGLLNSHAALVEALDYLVRRVEDWSDSHQEYLRSDAYRQAKQALTLATKETRS